MVRRNLCLACLSVAISGVFSAVACSQDVTEENSNFPEFFGVYAKLNDGRLIELQHKNPFQYLSYERSTSDGVNFLDNDLMRSMDALSSPPRAYYAQKPSIKVRFSEVEGFYIYGDYEIRNFFLIKFISSTKVLTRNTVLISDRSTGPGVRTSGTYVSANLGWSLDAAFRYREVKPKLYWLKLREDADILESEESIDFFVSVRLEGREYWPFALAASRHVELAQEAVAHWQAERYEKAIETAEISLELKPNPRAYFALSASMLGTKVFSNISAERIEDALQVAQKGAIEFPDDLLLLSLRAASLVALERYEKAMYSLNSLRTKGYNSPLVLSELAYCYVKQRINSGEALDLAKRALSKVGSENRAYCEFVLAECYLALGKPQKAIKFSQKALKATPGESKYIELHQRIENQLTSKKKRR